MTTELSPFHHAFGDWTPTAVVFDCDGLLLDTESTWVRAQATVLADFGTAYTPEESEATVGTALSSVVDLMARKIQQDVDTTTKLVVDHFVAELTKGIEVMPGAKEVVELAASKVPIACASNTESEFLAFKLDHAGIRHHFSAFVAADEVTEPKPAPDMYALAADKLGALPEQALGFEDSEIGATAARSAGLKLVTVPSIPGQDPAGDVRIAALTDPALVEWITSW